MTLKRASGVLLHPTSLPSPYGIGDLGRSAYQFLDRLRDSGQSWWQMLPLNVPGPGGSPYSAESAFAGNPALIDPTALPFATKAQEQELLSCIKQQASHARQDRVDFGSVMDNKVHVMRAVFSTLKPNTHTQFEEFCTREQRWLDDYAMFATLKDAHQGKSWVHWAPELVCRDKATLQKTRKTYDKEIALHKFMQWIFFEQWEKLKNEAHKRGIKLMGDIPIFVAMDSADVWANRDIFLVNETGQASHVAGVPPDYFSKTGQKWGNPLYDWDMLRQQGYSWWIDRVRTACATVDLVRIDHFRGFEAYWEVPSNAPTAETGRWVKGPGDDLFFVLQNALGKLPIIAEDLGMITDEVHMLRDAHHIPGMKVMHFGFDGDSNHPFLPHTYPEHCVAYAGTHDNDTTRGWFEALQEHERHKVRVYLSSSNEDIVDTMIARLLESKAALTIVALQDLYNLDSQARMNTPGTTEHNWQWRITQEQLDDNTPWDKLALWTTTSRRCT